jgi:hypothetical protein
MNQNGMRSNSQKKTFAEATERFKVSTNVGNKMANSDGSMALSEPAIGPVLISLERLRELEAIEASIPARIEQAILEHKKNNLRKLHEKDKNNPENVNLRVKRYAERHREELNLRRREKRRLKKLELEKKKEAMVVEQPIQSNEPVIVRFDDEPKPDVKPKTIVVRVSRKPNIIVGDTVLTM